jgi:tripeptidyl-peptidase I
MKLGLRGVTTVVSNGDCGVAETAINAAHMSAVPVVFSTPPVQQEGSTGPCSYITSVGATQIVPGAAITAAEVACETTIYSGGGFRNKFTLPSCQSSAMAKYFQEPHAEVLYHSVRPLPSHPGHEYMLIDLATTPPENLAGSLISLPTENGTSQQWTALAITYLVSAAASTVGSIITLINEARITAGKKPVGLSIRCCMLTRARWMILRRE